MPAAAETNGPAIQGVGAAVSLDAHRQRKTQSAAPQHSSGGEAPEARSESGFIGLTTGKALSILLGCVGVLAAGFLFLVVHVWDGISDDIKELRTTAHNDAATTQASLSAQSEASGEFKAFVRDQLPAINKQIAQNTNTVATLNAAVQETSRQVAALTETIDKLKDSVVLKKTQYSPPWETSNSPLDRSVGMTVCPDYYAKKGWCGTGALHVQ